MPSYVAGKVDGTALTRGARNRVNRFPGNVQTRDTRAPTYTRAYKRLRGKKKGKREKHSFEHIETDANNIARRRDKKSRRTMLRFVAHVKKK